MKIWGIGPSIAVTGAIGVTVALLLGTRFDVRFAVKQSDLLVIGCALMLVGMFLWFSSVRLLAKHFYAGELITHGVFGIVRNPLYAGVILFVTPGLALACNNWVILGIALLMFTVFKLQIHKEETALRSQFGEVYEAYARRTKQIIPWLW